MLEDVQLLSPLNSKTAFTLPALASDFFPDQIFFFFFFF